MDKFAVAVMPIADVEGWQEFAHEAHEGHRADAHRDFLRRGGITAEHIYHQPSPMGDLMVLVWEGIDQEGQARHLASVTQDPQTDHERYLRDVVIREYHGIDPDAAADQPPATHIGEIHV
jgi:hypothetical protein